MVFGFITVSGGIPATAGVLGVSGYIDYEAFSNISADVQKSYLPHLETV
jgi:hypothetical protein